MSPPLTDASGAIFDVPTVGTRNGPRRVLVAGPSTTTLINRQRLYHIRQNPTESELDRAIMREIRARQDERIRALVFRGRDDSGEQRWGFDDELTDVEATDLGYWLVKSRLPSFRRIIASGVWVVMNVEIGFREVEALRRGTAALLRELQTRSSPDSGLEHAALPVLRLDTWILKNLMFYFSLGYEKVLNETLPDMLPVVETRKDQVEELLKELPPGLA